MQDDDILGHVDLVARRLRIRVKAWRASGRGRELPDDQRVAAVPFPFGLVARLQLEPGLTAPCRALPLPCLGGLPARA